jgi:hypothetical protein
MPGLPVLAFETEIYRGALRRALADVRPVRELFVATS